MISGCALYTFMSVFMYMYVCESERLLREQWGSSHTQGSEKLGLGSPHGCLFQSWPLWRIKKSRENEWLVSVLAFLYMLPKSNAKQWSVFSSERNRDKGLYTAIAWSFILLVYWNATFHQGIWIVSTQKCKLLKKLKMSSAVLILKNSKLPH